MKKQCDRCRQDYNKLVRFEDMMICRKCLRTLTPLIGNYGKRGPLKNDEEV